MKELRRIFTVLHILVTEPSYQGKGPGSILIQHGLHLADGKDANVFLESSPRGLRLYEKFGFETVEEISLRIPGSLNLGKEDDELYVTSCMIRKKNTLR
jgi:GNAT superfamily N-acetyltransferase